MTGGLGLGSLSLATAHNGAPTPTAGATGIAAGQRLLWPHERSRPQRIAFALTSIGVFPMTSHTECVALLEPVDVCARLR